jgi:predicted lysophospholipase L1 biosynthesis ABC-type transport system permease subunit
MEVLNGSVRVRIENIGYASAITRALTGLGLQAENPGESLQAGWDAQLKEASYLAAIGAFGFICAAVLLAAWRRLFLLDRGESLEMLLWLGLRRKDIGRLFIIQALFLSAFGAAAGILASVALPPFLPEEAQGISVFALSIPGEVAATVAICCLLAGACAGFTRRVDVSTQ